MTLEAILSDLRPFLTIMLLMLVGCSFTLLFLSAAEDETMTVFSHFSTTYALTLGEFEQSAFSHNAVSYAFFVYFTFVVNVVLLNVLISIIGETFTRMQQEAPALRSLSKAQLLLHVQSHGSHSARPPTPFCAQRTADACCIV
jgi:hypothetical protein